MPTWTFVRHGQSVANATETFAGHTDSPLTSLGRQQAREARPRLAGISFTRALSSDLLRARDTADLLLADFRRGREGEGEGEGEGKGKGSAITITISHHGELRERCCGTWENRRFADAEAVGDMEVFRSWTARPPGGESLCEVATRAMRFLDAQDTGDDTLVICHGALIRAVIGVVDGTAPERIGGYKPGNLEFVTRTLARGRFAALLAALP